MQKNRFSTRRIALIGAIAAAYVALTLLFAPISFGAVQLRVSEVLMLLCFFSPDCCIALTIGCAISNLYSSMAILDVPIGAAATLLAAFCMYKSRSLVLASLMPALFNGVFIGLELYFFFDSAYTLVLTMLLVAAGELCVVCIAGLPLFAALSKNTVFARTFGEKPLRRH